MSSGTAGIYKAAVEAFGKKAQVLKLVEECGELIVACMHTLSGRPDMKGNLVDRCVAKDYKLTRLRGMIDARLGSKI